MKSKDKKEEFAGYWKFITGESLTAEREYRFHDVRRFRFDFAWPQYKIAVEVDGGVFAPGGGRHAKDPDREKLNLAAECGWFVFRYSVQMLKKDPQACVDQVRRVLNALA